MEVCAQHMFAPPEPIRARIPTVSPEIEQAVMIALTKDPSQRFASIQAFATALEQASRFEQAITYTPASQPADHQPFLFSNEANRTIPYHSDTSIQRPVPQASTFQPDFPSDMQQAEGVILYQSSLPDGRHKSVLAGEVTSQADSSLASSASGSGSLATSPGSSLQIRLPQRLRSPMSLLALCVVLVLVFVMGGSGLFYYIYATTNRPGPITSVVQPTPTSNLLARGPLAYSSTLSAQDSGQWDVFNFENNGYCRFDNNSYHIYMPSGNNYIVTCFAQRTNFSGNFTMEASMTLNQGFMIGVAFRANENNHYRFRISPDGSWDLVDNQGSQIAQGNSNAIKGLGQSNTLKVIARGTTFYLYINGQFVKQAIANTASGGMIGLFTVSSPTQTADARFSSISVWQP